MSRLCPLSLLAGYISAKRLFYLLGFQNHLLKYNGYQLASYYKKKTIVRNRTIHPM